MQQEREGDDTKMGLPCIEVGITQTRRGAKLERGTQGQFWIQTIRNRGNDYFVLSLLIF